MIKYFLSYQNTIHKLIVCCLIIVLFPLSIPLNLAEAKTSKSSSKNETVKDKWKLNLKDADIKELIGEVARITKKTFIVERGVGGNITVISDTEMNQKDIYELFLSVLRINGFGIVKTGKIHKIVNLAESKQGSTLTTNDIPESDRLVTRVIHVKFTEIGEILNVLRPLVPKRQGHISALPKSNAIVVSDHASNLKRLTALVDQLDRPRNEETEIIYLQEAWVGDIINVLEKLAPEVLSGSSTTQAKNLRLTANEKNNSIILRGEGENIRIMKKLIKQLDEKNTIQNSTKVVFLNYADAKELAPMLNNLVMQISESTSTDGSKKSTGISSIKPNIQADESSNALIIRAEPKVLKELMVVIKKLDIRKTQVLIEAAIVEISMSETDEAGFDYAIADRSQNNTLPFVNTALGGTINSLLGGLIDGNVSSPGLVQAAGSISSPTLAIAKVDTAGLSFGAIVQAIHINQNTNLLSTPSIMTIDNKKAKIIVGQNVPFRTGSFSSSETGSSNPFTTIKRQDIGITLEVTPHIHEGESLRLEIIQHVENVENSVAVGNNAFSDIVTNKRTIETTVIADNQQTIVLGGLMQNDQSERDKAVPILGQLPIIGYFFRTSSIIENKRNLLVFLKPTLLRTDDEAQDLTHEKYLGIQEFEITDTSFTPKEVSLRELIK